MIDRSIDNALLRSRRILEYLISSSQQIRPHAGAINLVFCAAKSDKPHAWSLGRHMQTLKPLPVVCELQGLAIVLALQKTNDLLKGVFASRRNSKLIALNSAFNLEF